MQWKKSWVFVLFLTIYCTQLVAGHVGYVIGEEERQTHTTEDKTLLQEALFNRTNVFLIALTIVIFLALYTIALHNKWFLHEIAYIAKEAKSYTEFMPWIARLGLGIALIGAGTADVLISPLLTGTSLLSFVQILLGFFLMAGLFVGPSIIATMILFLVALQQEMYLLGNLDFFALCIALLCLATAKPGIDDLLGLPFFLHLEKFKHLVPLLLRMGIGVSMIFLAIFEKFLHPTWSALVVTDYNLTNVIPVSVGMWVVAAGIIELLVGALLLIGFKTRLMSAIAFVVLSMSFFYFHEAVFSHITLFATLSLLFITGGGMHSVDKFLEKTK